MLLTQEMGWPTYFGPMGDIEIVNARRGVGLSDSAQAFIEVPQNEHGMHDGDRLRWTPEADMWIDDDGMILTEQHQPWRRKEIDMEFNRSAIPHHIHHEFQTPLYRRSNDISKEKRQALAKYEWDMVAKLIAWEEYKRMERRMARGHILQANLAERQNVLSE